ncbi:hypothetical protein QJS10_CPA03g00792 [Acorus calamus]|uniref:Uncharacterized protein n=1 Tax=Acorus calamus TaxID=4465 RepID=A0AAV9F679_ACOCL|nr:hypothetical protein QJS10_CPA03g00792 [Acorus calamus]
MICEETKESCVGCYKGLENELEELATQLGESTKASSTDVSVPRSPSAIGASIPPSKFFPPEKDCSQKFTVLEEEEIKEAEAAWGFILVGYVWGKDQYDLIVFTDCSLSSAMELQSLLSSFSKAKGLHLNSEKSQLFCTSNSKALVKAWEFLSAISQFIILGPHCNETTVDCLISDGKWHKPGRWPPEFDHIWEDISQLEVGGKGPNILQRKSLEDNRGGPQNHCVDLSATKIKTKIPAISNLNHYAAKELKFQVDEPDVYLNRDEAVPSIIQRVLHDDAEQPNRAPHGRENHGMAHR